MNAAAAANIRPAASVVVLRDAPAGLQVLLMRRPERDQDFRSGACVFPGGVVDAGDAAAHRWCYGLDDAQASRRLGEPAGGLDFFVAGLRECFEEVGLLYVCASDGAAVDLAAHEAELHAWRTRLHRGQATLAQLCEHFDWRLDLRDMAYSSHWLTPVVRPKRFDTRFFVRHAPPGQEAMPDYGEALELMWLTPAEALDPARGLKLLNVTQRTLQELRAFATADAAFEAALARRGVARILPRPVRGADGGMRFVIPGQPAYDEVARLDPEGRGHLAAELAPGALTRLSPQLVRVAGATCHAYVAGDEGGEQAVIDADPGDAAQWAALVSAAGNVRWLAWLHEPDADSLAAAQARWPAAQVLLPAALRPGLRIELGAAGGLQVPATADAPLLLVENAAMLLVGDANRFDAGDAEWIAAASGFLRRARPD